MKQNMQLKLALTLSLALGSGALAQAQTGQPNTVPTDDEEVILDTFEVTGSFAGSLAAATEMKQNLPVIAEVIAAEDIGKLPDVSIADSLTRLTGLTTQRTNGRSQAINIRGLTGDFSTGMLNGREQVSTGLNRAVEFDQYPAELLNQVIVYKSASAELTSQGLAGTIDLRTVQPLSKRGRVIALNGYYEWTEFSGLTPGADSTGERFNFSYIDQFDNGKVGIALGISHSSKPYEGKQFQAWGYPTDSDGNFMIGGTKSYVRTSNLDRDGLMAVLEFKPNDFVHATFDVYYSDFEEKQQLRGLEIPLAFWSSAVLQPGYTVTNGLITEAVLTNVQPVIRNDIFWREDKPKAIGMNVKLGDKSEWPVEFDVGYSTVERTDMNLETWSGLGFAQGAETTDTVTVRLSPGQIPQFTPTIDYSNPDQFFITDPQGWQTWMSPIGGPGWIKYLKAEDTLAQLKLSTSHKLHGFFSAVAFGASYTDRDKYEGEGPSGLIVNSNGQALAPVPEIIGTTDLGYLGIGEVFAYDPVALLENGLDYIPATTPDFVARQYKVREKITQLYAQVAIDTKVGELPLSGNIGVRAIRADQSSSGFAVTGNEANPVSGTDSYWDFAPSLNLNLEVAERTYLRFSLARQLARPRMYDMRAGRNWSYNPALAASTDLNNSPWSAGEAGNPSLRPWKANSIDLSFEKYFKEQRGYVSVAAFYKDLVHFVYAQTQVQDFTGYPVRSGPEPVLRQGYSTIATNGEGGSMKGVEATLSLASELLSENVKGFGFVGGVAYTDSTIKPWGPNGRDAPIAGLSKWVWNATLYYEQHGFSARISQRYRSENRQYITTFGPPNRGSDVSDNGSFSVAQPESVIDAQVSYTFPKEKLHGMTLYLQAYNLNNEPLVTYNNDDPRQVINFQEYGTSYSAGVAFRF